MHPFILRCTDPSNIGFAHLQLSRYGTLCQHLDTLQISHFPLILRFAMRFYPMRTTSLLYNRFRSGGSLCFIHCAGFRHQRSFLPVSAFCSLVSLPNSVFGATEPVFGATEPVFGATDPVFGATEPVFGATGPVFGTPKQVFGNSKEAAGLAAVISTIFQPFVGATFRRRS